jgi:hypothetical protein
LHLAVSIYAEANGGEYPVTLYALLGEYVSDERLLRFHLPGSDWQIDWLYIRPLESAKQPYDILIAAPAAWAPGGKSAGAGEASQRALIRVNGAFEMMAEDEFIRLLKACPPVGSEAGPPAVAP